MPQEVISKQLRELPQNWHDGWQQRLWFSVTELLEGAASSLIDAMNNCLCTQVPIGFIHGLQTDPVFRAGETYSSELGSVCLLAALLSCTPGCEVSFCCSLSTMAGPQHGVRLDLGLLLSAAPRVQGSPGTLHSTSCRPVKSTSYIKLQGSQVSMKDSIWTLPTIITTTSESSTMDAELRYIYVTEHCNY